MRSSGTTVVGHFFLNDSIVRNAPSGSNYRMELHEVVLDGSGDGVIYTGMDKPLGFTAGIEGTAAGTLPIVADLANKTVDATDDELYNIAVWGDAGATVYIQLYGMYEGS